MPVIPGRVLHGIVFAGVVHFKAHEKEELMHFFADLEIPARMEIVEILIQNDAALEKIKPPVPGLGEPDYLVTQNALGAPGGRPRQPESHHLIDNIGVRLIAVIGYTGPEVILIVAGVKLAHETLVAGTEYVRILEINIQIFAGRMVYLRRERREPF